CPARILRLRERTSAPKLIPRTAVMLCWRRECTALVPAAHETALRPLLHCGPSTLSELCVDCLQVPRPIGRRPLGSPCPGTGHLGHLFARPLIFRVALKMRRASSRFKPSACWGGGSVALGVR